MSLLFRPLALRPARPSLAAPFTTTAPLPKRLHGETSILHDPRLSPSLSPVPLTH
jgi:hypothetical protein